MTTLHVRIDYTNWRGERASRVIVPDNIFFGSNEWHPELQWLLNAWDAEKDDNRTFAMANIHKWEIRRSMMIASPSAISTMRGEQVFALVRDVCANESARIRSLEDELIKLGFNASIDPGRLSVILALNAAADMCTHAIAAGQDAKLDSRVRKAPEWVVCLADQARAALMNDGP